MKKFLLTLLQGFFLLYCSFCQNAASTTEKIKKEISISYVFIYPGDFLPSVEFSISKVISPSLQFGFGLTEIYFRYRKRMYVPVFAVAEIKFGKKKRVSLNFQSGYGIYNYKWDNGNVFIEEKGSFYVSAGPKYAFKIKNSAINCSVNLVNPITKETINNKSTAQIRSSIVNNSGINLKIGVPF